MSWPPAAGGGRSGASRSVRFRHGFGRKRLTFGLENDGEPSLVLAPQSTPSLRAIVGWMYDDLDRLRFAEAGYDGRWTATGVTRPAGHPDLFAYGPVVFGAFSDLSNTNGRTVQITTPPPRTRSNTFHRLGRNPKVAASGDRTFVAWTSHDWEQMWVGEATGPGVAAEMNLTPTSPRQVLVGLTARGGKATVIGVSISTSSTGRLWAAAQQ
jgi:hypothetical protein